MNKQHNKAWGTFNSQLICQGTEWQLLNKRVTVWTDHR